MHKKRKPFSELRRQVRSPEAIERVEHCVDKALMEMDIDPGAAGAPPQ